MYESFSDDPADRETGSFGGETPYVPPELNIVPGGWNTGDAHATIEQPIVANGHRHGPQPDTVQPYAESQEIPPEDTAGADSPGEAADRPAADSADLEAPAAPVADGGADKPPVPPTERPVPNPEEPEPEKEQPTVTGRLAFDIAPFADERPTPEEIPLIADRHGEVITAALDKWSDFVDKFPDDTLLSLEYLPGHSRHTRVLVSPGGNGTMDVIAVEQYNRETGVWDKHEYHNIDGTVRYLLTPSQHFQAGSVSHGLAQELYAEAREGEKKNFQLAYDMGYIPPVGPMHMAHIEQIVNNAQPRINSFVDLDNVALHALTDAFNPSPEDSLQGAKELTECIRSYHGITTPEQPRDIGPIISNDGTIMSITIGSENTESSRVRIEASSPLEFYPKLLEEVRAAGLSEEEKRFSINTTLVFGADELQLTVSKTTALSHESGNTTPLHDQLSGSGDTAIARVVRNFLRRPVVGRKDILPKENG